jgi:wyosine [tRNA(Phe)-imidazoG37] synthetase (radical SAM superfamily)
MITDNNSYIYGPIKSRRLGLSLGINLTPCKICSFDCVYCQVGRTTLKTVERKEYVEPELVFRQLRNWLKNNLDAARNLNYITIAGHGEPTLHSGLEKIISGIKEIISLPVAVITNSSLLVSATLRQELHQADLVVPSLDAVTQDILEKIDRPAVGINVNDILKALIDFRKGYKGKIWLEIMLVRGINDSPEHIAALKKAVEMIKPDKIQLNSPVRHTAEEGILSLEPATLQEIARQFGTIAEVV